MTAFERSLSTRRFSDCRKGPNTPDEEFSLVKMTARKETVFGNPLILLVFQWSTNRAKRSREGAALSPRGWRRGTGRTARKDGKKALGARYRTSVASRPGTLTERHGRLPRFRPVVAAYSYTSSEILLDGKRVLELSPVNFFQDLFAAYGQEVGTLDRLIEFDETPKRIG